MEELLFQDNKVKDHDESFLFASCSVTDVEYGEALRKGPAALKPYGAQGDLRHVWGIFFYLFAKWPTANGLIAPKKWR